MFNVHYQFVWALCVLRPMKHTVRCVTKCRFVKAIARLKLNETNFAMIYCAYFARTHEEANGTRHKTFGTRESVEHKRQTHPSAGRSSFALPHELWRRFQFCYSSLCMTLSSSCCNFHCDAVSEQLRSRDEPSKHIFIFRRRTRETEINKNCFSFQFVFVLTAATQFEHLRQNRKRKNETKQARKIRHENLLPFIAMRAWEVTEKHREKMNRDEMPWRCYLTLYVCTYFCGLNEPKGTQRERWQKKKLFYIFHISVFRLRSLLSHAKFAWLSFDLIFPCDRWQVKRK